VTSGLDNQEGSAPMPTPDKHVASISVHVYSDNIGVDDLSDDKRDLVVVHLPLKGGGVANLLGTLEHIGALADELASQVAAVSTVRSAIEDAESRMVPAASFAEWLEGRYEHKAVAS
jgi:hypothetical protein